MTITRIGRLNFYFKYCYFLYCYFKYCYFCIVFIFVIQLGDHVF